MLTHHALEMLKRRTGLTNAPCSPVLFIALPLTLLERQFNLSGVPHPQSGDCLTQTGLKLGSFRKNVRSGATPISPLHAPDQT
jgi:hypothetical protein